MDMAGKLLVTSGNQLVTSGIFEVMNGWRPASHIEEFESQSRPGAACTNKEHMFVFYRSASRDDRMAVTGAFDQIISMRSLSQHRSGLSDRAAADLAAFDSDFVRRTTSIVRLGKRYRRSEGTARETS